MKALITQIPERDLLDLHIARMEEGEKVRMEIWKSTGRYPEEGCLVVQDLRGLSFKHLYTPALPVFQKFNAIDADHYPEGLMRLYFVNVPSVFTVLWNVVKNFIDRRTLDKMVITGAGFLDQLKQEVPPENIPPYLGGLCDKCPNGLCVPDAGRFDAAASYTQVVIGARDRYEHVVNVERHGSLITWEFKTEAHDIGFALLRKRDGKLSEVVSAHRFKSNISLIRDQYQVKHGELGEYVVRFDNSHSMMRKKTLKYEIVVETPPEELAAAQIEK